MPSNPKNFNVDSVRVVKIMGASLLDSRAIRGMVFGREPESTPLIFFFPLLLVPLTDTHPLSTLLLFFLHLSQLL